MLYKIGPRALKDLGLLLLKLGEVFFSQLTIEEFLKEFDTTHLFCVFASFFIAYFDCGFVLVFEVFLNQGNY